MCCKKEYLSSNNASIVKTIPTYAWKISNASTAFNLILEFYHIISCEKIIYSICLTALHIKNSFCMTNALSLLSYQYSAKPYCLSDSRPKIFSNDFFKGQCGKGWTTACSDFNKSHNGRNCYLLSNWNKSSISLI